MAYFEKRIALVCFSGSLGGLELSTLRLAQKFTEKGAPALLVAPPHSPLEQRARESNLSVVSLTPRWKYGDLLTAASLARALKEYRTDVVILMQSKDIHLAALARVLVPRVKLVFYQQMQSRHNKRDIFHTWIYSRLSLWISLTESMKEDVLASTKMTNDKVKVIPLGVDLFQFDPDSYHQSEARVSFQLPLHKTIVGVIGRLDAQKGQEVLLRAAPYILENHPDTLFLIVGEETAGEGGYKEKLKDLCQTLDIERHVRFLPFTDGVPQLMAALDMFILPSFSETFGLVVIEAMAMGKPIVATNAGGVPEIIRHGETGMLVEPRDERALAQAIHTILSDNELRTSLSYFAREEALNHCSVDRCVESLLEAVEAL